MAEATPANSISLRPVTTEDAPFLLTLYKSSRGDDLRGLGWEEERVSEFLDMQYEAQQRFHANEYQQPVDQIVMRDGEPIGRLMFEPREHEIRCVDIALQPRASQRRHRRAVAARTTDRGEAAEEAPAFAGNSVQPRDFAVRASRFSAHQRNRHAFSDGMGAGR